MKRRGLFSGLSIVGSLGALAACGGADRTTVALTSASALDANAGAPRALVARVQTSGPRPDIHWKTKAIGSDGLDALQGLRDGGLAYVVGFDVVRLGPSGEELWRHRTDFSPGQLVETPDGGLVVFQSITRASYPYEQTPRVARLDGAGAEKWQMAPDVPPGDIVGVRSAYDASNDTAYLAYSQDLEEGKWTTLIIAVGSDGHERWRTAETGLGELGFAASAGRVFFDGWLDVEASKTPQATRADSVNDKLWHGDAETRAMHMQFGVGPDEQVPWPYDELVETSRGSDLVFAGVYALRAHIDDTLEHVGIRTWTVSPTGEVSADFSAPHVPSTSIGTIAACGDAIYFPDGYRTGFDAALLRALPATRTWEWIADADLGGDGLARITCLADGTIAIGGKFDRENALHRIDPSALVWHALPY